MAMARVALHPHGGTFGASAALCLLLSFLLLSVPGLAEEGLVRKDCSSSCGQIHNITSPFRLNSDPPGCGDPNYELICEGNKTILDYSSIKFYVAEISYVNQTIRVVDMALASRRCSLPHQSNSPLDTISERYWAEGICTSFVYCTKKVDNLDYRFIPCLSRNQTYVYAMAGCSVGDLTASCGFLAMTWSAYNISESPQADVFKNLQMGFDLTWEAIPTKAPSVFRSVKYCLRKGDLADGEWRIKIEHVLGQMLYPIIYEMEFSSCLHSELCVHDRSHDAKYCGSYRATVALVIILDIILFLLGIRILGQFVFAPVSVLLFLAYEFWTKHVSIDAIEKFLQSQQTLTPTRYTYIDIIAMTSHFKEKLGQGGFGSVFKGELPGGRLVAVKMLADSRSNGDDFISEVSTMGTIHHVNVVQLVGFCSDGSKRALVYEYMPNGSLDKFIFSSHGAAQSTFTWEKLTNIAIGVAHGIDYLHEGCDMQILHFDIKPNNILLDHNFNSKISDFGLARLYPKDYSLVSISGAIGTIGYIAPEFISRNFGLISYKSDVYSFGMLLMDIAGGRRNFNPRAGNSSQQVYYPSWIYDRLNQGDRPEINDTIEISQVDSTLSPEISAAERKLCTVGLWCIQMRPSNRPSMSKVVEMLEADVDSLQMPPKPFFSSPQPSVVQQSGLDSSLASELSIILEHDE